MVDSASSTNTVVGRICVEHMSLRLARAQSDARQDSRGHCFLDMPQENVNARGRRTDATRLIPPTSRPPTLPSLMHVPRPPSLPSEIHSESN